MFITPTDNGSGNVILTLPGYECILEPEIAAALHAEMSAAIGHDCAQEMHAEVQAALRKRRTGNAE